MIYRLSLFLLLFISCSAFSQVSYNCQAQQCISLDYASDFVVTDANDNSLGRLYEARANVMSQISNLVPHITFSVGVKSGVSGDIFGGLFGFLAPSNWYSFKESRLFYLAEKYGFLGALSNALTSVEILYYNIHRLHNDDLIYKAYIEKTADLINEFRENPAIDKNSILRLEQLLAVLTIEQKKIADIINSVVADFGMALSIEDGWGNFDIEALTLPELLGFAHLDVDTFKEKVIENSNSIKSIKYLRIASRFSKRAAYWAFLSPEQVGEFGIDLSLSYLASIKVAKSTEEMLLLEEDGAKQESIMVLRKAIATHNSAIDLYSSAQSFKNKNIELFEGVLADYHNQNVLDVSALNDAITTGIKLETTKNFAQHLYLISRSALDYLQNDADKYKKLESFVPKNKRLNRFEDHIQIRENHRIDRAIKRGNLHID